MALKSGIPPLFTPRWVSGLAPVAESGMGAGIEVYTSSLDRVYDIATDTWSSSPDTIHYAGVARVQPIRSARDSSKPGDATSVELVRVQIPIAATFDIRPDQRVRVVYAPLNPHLLGYQLVVHEIVNSSNPFEQTFECTVNNETAVV